MIAEWSLELLATETNSHGKFLFSDEQTELFK